MKYTTTENKLQNFEAFQEVLTSNNLLVLNRGVEIGVRDGIFSEHLLAKNAALKMVCVDPYLPYMDIDKFYTKEDQQTCLNNAANKLRTFNDRVTWLYYPSAVAYSLAADSVFDFVFIDAEHTFAACYTDCRLWAPKVRKGGILAGHDLHLDVVKEAVNKFAEGRTVYHVPYLADIWFIEV